jgi:hypothetical protein
LSNAYTDFYFYKYKLFILLVLYSSICKWRKYRKCMYYGFACLHSIMEQSLPTFKDLFKENLNINRFICACVHNGRKKRQDTPWNFLSNFLYKTPLLICVVFRNIFFSNRYSLFYSYQYRAPKTYYPVFAKIWEFFLSVYFCLTTEFLNMATRWPLTLSKDF